MMITEWKKRSIRAKEVERIIRISGNKRKFKEMSEEEFQKQMEEAEKNYEKPFPNPEKIIRRNVEEFYINDKMQTFVWGNEDANHIILYFHGGAYVYPPMLLHFKAVDNIAKKTGARVYFPIYPRIPAYHFKDVYPLVDKLYSDILKTAPPESVTLMGDSAGGGIALGFALWLKDFDLPQPKNIILISPWLDVTMSNKSMEKYEKKDPLLAVWGLRKMGQIWAGGKDDRIMPYVSPIYGDHEGLGKITMLVGTRELFYPEVMRFSKLLHQQKIDYNLLIAHKMNHAFPVMPIPEGRRSQNFIADIINEKI